MNKPQRGFLCQSHTTPSVRSGEREKKKKRRKKEKRGGKKERERRDKRKGESDL